MNEVLARIPAFVSHHALLATAFAAIITVLIVTELMRLARPFKELTPAALTNLINRDNALLVDLSGQAEFEKGHIPGARHVDMAQFDPEHKDLAKARELPVVVCCKTGNKSTKAAQRLAKAGFKHVYMLAGGVDAWRGAKMPLAKGRG